MQRYKQTHTPLNLTYKNRKRVVLPLRRIKVTIDLLSVSLTKHPSLSAPKKPTDDKIKSCYIASLTLNSVPANAWYKGQSHARVALTALVQVTLGGRWCRRPLYVFPLNSHEFNSCQLFTLSLWGGSSGFSQERWNCCFASDLLNLLLCARQWQRLPILRVKRGGVEALVVSGGSGARLSNGNELGRNKRDGQSSTHTVNHICINA